jgi:hypothetical protein
MALKKQITLKSNFGDDVLFNDAYIKIENVTGNKLQIRADVSIHKKVDEQIIERTYYAFVPSMDGGNFIKQAYEHLKTLPEFAGATDC